MEVLVYVCVYVCVCVPHWSDSLLKTQKGPLWHPVSGVRWLTLRDGLWSQENLFPPSTALMINDSSHVPVRCFAELKHTHSYVLWPSIIFFCLTSFFWNQTTHTCSKLACVKQARIYLALQPFQEMLNQNILQLTVSINQNILKHLNSN